eukprot:2425039-Rhodomonas_salina.3
MPMLGSCWYGTGHAQAHTEITHPSLRARAHTHTHTRNLTRFCTQASTSPHARLAVAGDGIVGFEDFNNSLFETALGERDYFSVTQKPCAIIANELSLIHISEPTRPRLI